MNTFNSKEYSAYKVKRRVNTYLIVFLIVFDTVWCSSQQKSLWCFLIERTLIHPMVNVVLRFLQRTWFGSVGLNSQTAPSSTTARISL